MEKIILLFVGVLVLGVTGMNAQERDTTLMKGGREGVAALAEPSSHYTKDMVQITAMDIPASLRSKLQGSRYKGWENATFYRSQNYEGYVVEMKDGEKIKTFRFDGNGRPIPDHE
ncbi:hypothetical protein [Chryseolinea soli]|uniref:Uncharacterized protein n=1 Tax=Chryseolinea soli TaxID=2321403 RepID=A0A385SSN5_9BACT|nr:hypothetical protein [Chryseolinea soli]AYB33005.1 hypothetical protein D4L85_21570 [Chryseolinea soli]